MGITSDPGFWIWMLFLFFVLVFLIIIIVLFTTGFSTPKESEQIFTFPNVQTNRHGNALVDVYLKVRLKGGTKEHEIPLTSEHETTVVVILNDLVSHPVNTKWSILAQAIGHAVNNREEICAVSCMIEVGAPIVERAVYTEGVIHPLEKL